MSRSSTVCPLCHTGSAHLFHRDARRSYLLCHNCGLVFVPPSERLSFEEERVRYDTHNNDPLEPRYRAFVGRLIPPLIKGLPRGSRGLDFGSGPGSQGGSALSLQLVERGFPTSVYDPLYAPNREVLTQKYDFVALTEVLEHLHHPLTVLQEVRTLLHSGGRIGVMTKRVTSPEAFRRWHYIRDPTHVCFFSEPPFRYCAQQLSMALQLVGSDMALLTL